MDTEPDLIPVPDAALRLDLPVTRIHQLLRDGQLVAIRLGDGPLLIPAGFLGDDGAPVKGLPGVITLLRDAHFSDTEIVDWMHRTDDSIPGTPIQALRENRGTEIKRRAQAAGF